MSTDETRQIEVCVEPGCAGMRLDKFVGSLPDVPSRSFAEKAISKGLVTVNGHPVRPSYRVAASDRVKVIISPPVEIQLIPQEIQLETVYEDKDLLIINKPRGLVVHPGAGHHQETLVNALLYHCSDLSGIGGELRPGIVHRLDKDTTGLLVVAKNDATHLALARALKSRDIHRWYLALTHNQPKAPEGLIDAPIGRHRVNRKKMAVVPQGRPAVTWYRVVKLLPRHALLQLKLQTGRTHQIRVHLAHVGLPVVADPVYGSGLELELAGQALHACRLRLVHPRTQEVLDFFAPLPVDFEQAWQRLGGENIDYSRLAIDNWGLDC